MQYQVKVVTCAGYFLKPKHETLTGSEMKNVTLTARMMQHRAHLLSIKHINHSFIPAFFLKERIKLIYQ